MDGEYGDLTPGFDASSAQAVPYDCHYTDAEGLLPPEPCSSRAEVPVSRVRRLYPQRTLRAREL
jgi:hypothetical protein